jgi:gliding motility-associated-like protein
MALRASSQVDVTLYQQFNGRYDFTFIGNTLNTTFNGASGPCVINTTSSADLTLNTDDIVEAAYLYWAGSGIGDFDITVNGEAISAERDFPALVTTNGVSRSYFSAFADITELVLQTGNGTYTIADFDLTDVINDSFPLYCENATNFGGWAVLIVYKNDNLELDQVNVYDGLQFLANNIDINITLDYLNVIDNLDSKIGFIAWEGDANIAVEERLKINGITMSNALNPFDNAFNSTNTITGSTDLYNMDLDVYSMEDVIETGDEFADIQLESGQDFVMANAIVTKINSILPDATVTFGLEQECDSRTFTVNYTIHNDNATDILPANTPVSVYLNGDLIDTFFTINPIAINGSESGTMTITLPAGAPDAFDLIFIADDDGTGEGIVTEISETNNNATFEGMLWVSPTLAPPADVTACNTGDGTGIFDFSDYTESLKNVPTDTITFYTSQAAAEAGGDDNITDIASYPATANPEEVFVRLTDEHGCFAVSSFDLVTVLCADATIVVNDIVQNCDSRELQVSYTVNNPGELPLPAGTAIAVYANGTLLEVTATVNEIAIGASENGSITLTIPAGIPLDFNLVFVVDDSGTGTGTVPEMNETNNSFTIAVSLWVSPVLQQPADVEACETTNGSGEGLFDFSDYTESLKNNPTDVVTFHASLADANDGTNDIPNPDEYTATDATEIFVRLEDEHGCYDTASFRLLLIDCYFPDATVTIDDVYKQCNSRIIHVHYTVYNSGSTDVLPAGTPVAIYVNGELLEFTETVDDIAIGESEPGFILLTIPIGVPLDFDLTFVVDDTGDGTGIIVESDETNNDFTLPTSLVLSPVLQQPADITSCDKGNGVATFDFSHYAQELQNYPDELVTFYTSQQNADQDLDRIYNTSNYITSENPQRIFVRLDNGTCHTTASFLLYIKKCQPIPYNYVTPNGDGLNDGFFVEGLRDVFLNFKITIYNRWGTLIWTGNNSMADWDTVATVEKVGAEGTTVPVGTYYYVIELNDPDYPEPMVGWVYVTK